MASAKVSGIFKAYDIRGLVPEELNEEIAYRVGLAFVRFLQPSKVVVGRDVRRCSPALSEAVTRGLTDAGADVLKIGLCSTPMLNFAVNFLAVDGGIMLTASHNPKDYGGLKLCGKEARPIGEQTGLSEIEKIVKDEHFQPAADRGEAAEVNLFDNYKAHVLRFAGEIAPLKLAVDTGNGVGGVTLPPILEALGLQCEWLFKEPDPDFPNHDPNPLEAENLLALQEAVLSNKADLGVAVDGDVDRAFFVDEEGRVLSADLIVALIAADILRQEPGAEIVYDVRCSWAVKEEIERLGGKALRWKVGHTFMKEKLRETGAPFAGELSGHCYFRDNFCTDSAAITILKLLSIISRYGKPPSEMLKPLRRYFHSGELNSLVEEKQARISELKRLFSDGNLDQTDGLTVEYEDWWFNVRPSNTEPLLRLNLEAKSPEKMERMKAKLLRFINEPLRPVRTILCPVDFSEDSKKALDHAVDFARAYGACLHLLHVVPTLEYAGYLDEYLPAPSGEFYAQLVQQSEHELRELASTIRGIALKRAVRKGNPYAEIVTYANKIEADFVVLSTHGRSAIREFFFGSTAEKILRKARCPVIIVPSEGVQPEEGGTADDDARASS